MTKKECGSVPTITIGHQKWGIWQPKKDGDGRPEGREGPLNEVPPQVVHARLQVGVKHVEHEREIDGNDEVNNAQWGRVENLPNPWNEFDEDRMSDAHPKVEVKHNESLGNEEARQHSEKSGVDQTGGRVWREPVPRLRESTQTHSAREKVNVSASGV
jgi:hypothetical protein